MSLEFPIDSASDGPSASQQLASQSIICAISGDLAGARPEIEVSHDDSAWAPVWDSPDVPIIGRVGAGSMVIPADWYVRVNVRGAGAATSAIVVIG